MCFGNKQPPWQEPPQFLNCLKGFSTPLWKAVFAFSVSNGMAKTYPELFKPRVKCPAQFTVLGSAYSCLLSRNSVSAVFINGFKNCVEINTEQGHDLAFFKLCCHTFYVCHCQMGEKSFQLSTKYGRQHL